MRITCKITNENFDITIPEYKEKVKLYGNEDNLQKFYIQEKFVNLIQRGFSIEKIAELYNLNISDPKSYKDVIKFHKNTNTISSVECSKETHVKSSKGIKSFLTMFERELIAASAS